MYAREPCSLRQVDTATGLGDQPYEWLHDPRPLKALPNGGHTFARFLA